MSDFCASNGEMGVHVQAFFGRGVYSEADVRQGTFQISCCDLMGELVRHDQVMEFIKQAPKPLPSIDILNDEFGSWLNAVEYFLEERTLLLPANMV